MVDREGEGNQQFTGALVALPVVELKSSTGTWLVRNFFEIVLAKRRGSP